MFEKSVDKKAIEKSSEQYFIQSTFKIEYWEN